jgi:hypothetical protein
MAHGRIAGIFKAPLHILASVPIAAAALVVPPIGKRYVAWRAKSERADQVAGRDTPEKAKIDLWSQTALVKGV